MIRTQTVLVRSALAGLALVFASTVASEALAAPPKSTQTEARFVSFDAAANTVTIKPAKSRGPNKKMLKKGREVTLNVLPDGSILTRTSVAINGKKGHVSEIPAGKQVNVYWIPDPKKDGEFFAKKIDVVLSEDELDALYGAD